MIDLPWLQTHIHTQYYANAQTDTLTHTNTLFSDKLLF